MHYDAVELHNVAELREVDGHDGLRLQRVPEAVRRHFNDGARERMIAPTGCEIRFVGESARVTLSCPGGRCDVRQAWGPFLESDVDAIGPEPRTLEISMPDRIAALDPAVAERQYVRPSVCRLLLWGEPVHVHGVSGDVRPPRPAELPDLRYLAYGTSITEGFNAIAGHLTYVAQTARRLGADSINLGSSGSAYCEPELADYVAERGDWDVATLSLSVNMLAAGFDLEAFRERARYLVETMAAAHPETPVACITLFPFYGDVCEPIENANWAATPAEYRDALRTIAAESPGTVHLIEGSELLADLDGLTPDVLHPSDHGMIRIGEALAPRLAELVRG